MPPSELELVEKLALAERDLLEAKRKMAEAKKAWTDAETTLVNTKVHRDNVREELRVHRNTVPKHEPSLRDKEIERFREENAELCEWARIRDELKAKGNE